MDENCNEKYRKAGSKVVALAIKENENNNELVEVLNEGSTYFDRSTRDNFGENRNSVVHCYQHPRFWREEDFIKLIEYIAKLSPIAYDK